jgi:hypothetical protein
MPRTEQSLTEALTILGIRHEPSKIEGKRDWYARDGEYLGAHDASEGWKYVNRFVQSCGRE